MSPFGEELLFDIAFAGFCQAALAVVLAVPVCLIAARYHRVGYSCLLRRYTLFNFFLFVWSALGNYFWLRLTWGRIAVLDDAPVWASFIPFGRYLLDHAAGRRDDWHLLGDTTIAQLKLYWAATAIPVWLLTIASMFIYLRTYAARTTTQMA